MALQVNAELRQIAKTLIAEQVREEDPGFMNDLNYLRNVQNRTAMTTISMTTTTTTTTTGAADSSAARNLSLDQSYNRTAISCLNQTTFGTKLASARVTSYYATNTLRPSSTPWHTDITLICQFPTQR